MDRKLVDAINAIVNHAYPDSWETEWLSLPLSKGADISSYSFHVICSDLDSIKIQKSTWPPSSSNPKTWIQWEGPGSEGFWIRPRQYDPILRDRLILVRAGELLGSEHRTSINQKDVIDACYFAADSLRIVWHNPPKGGARRPQSAHFQSAPLYWDGSGTRKYTFPCCLYQGTREPWHERVDIHVQLLERGLDDTHYPALGLTVAGPIESVAAFVWSIIWDYDYAAACNLVIQPDDQSYRADIIRVFVFPRARQIPNYSVTEQLLTDEEKLLAKNNRGGKQEDWSFAGVEMGLLTQMEWGPVFEAMSTNLEQWGITFLRLLEHLTLKEDDTDWTEFIRIVERHRAAL